MIKLTIFNIKEFLQVVNNCIGAVNVIYPDGSKENINQRSGVQQELESRYSDSNECLKLELDIPTAKDYMDIIYYYIGDC